MFSLLSSLEEGDDDDDDDLRHGKQGKLLTSHTMDNFLQALKLAGMMRKFLVSKDLELKWRQEVAKLLSQCSVENIGLVTKFLEVIAKFDDEDDDSRLVFVFLKRKDKLMLSASSHKLLSSFEDGEYDKDEVSRIDMQQLLSFVQAMDEPIQASIVVAKVGVIPHSDNSLIKERVKGPLWSQCLFYEKVDLQPRFSKLRSKVIISEMKLFTEVEDHLFLTKERLGLLVHNTVDNEEASSTACSKFLVKFLFDLSLLSPNVGEEAEAGMSSFEEDALAMINGDKSHGSGTCKLKTSGELTGKLKPKGEMMEVRWTLGSGGPEDHEGSYSLGPAVHAWGYIPFVQFTTHVSLGAAGVSLFGMHGRRRTSLPKVRLNSFHNYYPKVTLQRPSVLKESSHDVRMHGKFCHAILHKKALAFSDALLLHPVADFDVVGFACMLKGPLVHAARMVFANQYTQHMSQGITGLHHLMAWIFKFAVERRFCLLPFMVPLFPVIDRVMEFPPDFFTSRFSTQGNDASLFSLTADFMGQGHLHAPFASKSGHLLDCGFHCSFVRPKKD